MAMPVKKVPPVKVLEVYLEKRGVTKRALPKISPKEELLRNYELIWSAPDAMEEGYFWITDFMEKRGFNIIKPMEVFRFGIRTPEWQQTQQKLQGEMNMATGLLNQITQKMRLLTGMYSQKQKVTQMLRLYKEGKEPDEFALKGLWVDYVDAKTAGASIIGYERNYEYITLRDLFFSCKTYEEIDKSPVNEKVKIVAKRKLAQYLKWREEWQVTLKKAFDIIEEEIKRYENEVELYKEWVKPILKDITLLQMRSIPEPKIKWQADPYIVEMVNQGTGFIKVIGWFGIKEDDINKSIEKLNKKEKELKKQAGVKLPFLGELGGAKDKLGDEDYEEEAKELMLKNKYGLWVPIMQLNFYTGFTAAPQPKWSGYKMAATVKVISLDLFLKNWREDWTVDPGEKWINQVLDPLNKAKEEAEEASKPEEAGIVQMTNSIKNFFDKTADFINKIIRFFTYSSHEIYLKKEKAKEDLWGKSWTIYEKFKKAHAMLTWGKYVFKSVGSGLIKVI